MVDPAVPPPPSTEVARKSEQRGAAYFLRALEIDTRMLGMVDTAQLMESFGANCIGGRDGNWHGVGHRHSAY